jgi:hypothetical protein
MTTDCMTDRYYACADRDGDSATRKLHDAVVGLAVTVMLIIPATLAIFTVL